VLGKPGFEAAGFREIDQGPRDRHQEGMNLPSAGQRTRGLQRERAVAHRHRSKLGPELERRRLVGGVAAQCIGKLGLLGGGRLRGRRVVGCRLRGALEEIIEDRADAHIFLARTPFTHPAYVGELQEAAVVLPQRVLVDSTAGTAQPGLERLARGGVIVLDARLENRPRQPRPRPWTKLANLREAAPEASGQLGWRRDGVDVREGAVVMRGAGRAAGLGFRCARGHGGRIFGEAVRGGRGFRACGHGEQEK
jgi:hypothetical protein